jgi:hypothetical protein
MKLPAAEAPALYIMRICLAFRAAGRSDSGWNRRFRGALDGLLLEIRQQPHDRDLMGLYPIEGPLLAPWPRSGPDGWPGDSLICWGPAARVAFSTSSSTTGRGRIAAAIHTGRWKHVAHPHRHAS